MEKPLFLRNNYLYVFGLIVLVTGLPLSLFLISISQFILAGSFLLEGNLKEKFSRFARNKAALLLAGIWFMHVAGMLWTSDLTQGWNDIRIKLPLLILTIVMAGTPPLQRKQFHLVVAFFIAAVFAGSLVSMAVLHGIIHRTVVDIRDVFIFRISHIRFGLFTCLSIFLLLHFILSKNGGLKPGMKLFAAAMAVWLFLFLITVELITGLIICVVILAIIGIHYVFSKQSRVGKIAITVMAILLPVVAFMYMRNLYNENYAQRLISIDVNAKTEQGNPYTFNLDNPEMENGYPAYIYMCEEELRSAWNKRSAISYDSLDMKMQPLRFTLIRFLASKGLRKDSAAMAVLTDEEIRSIERGVPNVNFQSPSIKVRLMQVIWEFEQYTHGGDPNGHSIMQRMESWKASWNVVCEHPLLGVGTGDLPFEVHRQYALMNSRLNADHYLRSHNQYLSIAAAFGITGFIYFLFALLYPVTVKENRNYFYLTFILTVLFSMLTEDTLETQPGATFFAFFNAFFLFALPKDKK